MVTNSWPAIQAQRRALARKAFSMIIHLPDPAAARVQHVQADENGITVQFGVRDAGHRDALLAVLEKAEREGFGLELRLIHYEGTPTMAEQAAARKARKR